MRPRTREDPRRALVDVELRRDDERRRGALGRHPAAQGSCLGIATDDSHYAGQDSRLAWTTVRAPERSRTAVLAAVRSGSFYSSTGAEIHGIDVHDDGRVDVRTSPARSVTLRSGRWDGCHVNAHPLEMHWRGSVVERAGDGSIVAARFDAPEFEKWGRVEVVGRDGTVAWSNPFAVG